MRPDVELLPWDGVWRVPAGLPAGGGDRAGVAAGGGAQGAVWGLTGPAAAAVVAALARGADPGTPTERPWVACVMRADGTIAASSAMTTRAGFVWAVERDPAGAGLIVAAALAPLLAAWSGPLTLDEDFVRAGLALATATSPSTPYRGVHREFPGETLEWVAPQAPPRRVPWCTAEVWPEPTVSGPGVVGEYRRAFDDVVADLLPADGPLCATLSAGLDSSFVVATMARMTTADRPVHAYVHSPLPAAGLGPLGRFDPDDYQLALAMQRAYPGRVQLHRVINEQLAQPLRQAEDTVLRTWAPPVNAPNHIWLHLMARDVRGRGGSGLFMGEQGNPAFSSDHPYALAYHLGRRQWREALTIGRPYPGDPGPRVRTGLPQLARRGAAAGRDLRRTPQAPPVYHADYLSPAVARRAPKPPASGRAAYLDWLRPASARSLASAPASWEVPLIDPFSARRVTELAVAITPAAWSRGGTPRGLARLIGADRVPPEIRHRVRRGGQSMDAWFVMAHEPGLYLQEADALDPLLAEVLDGARLRDELAGWPWEQPRAAAPKGMHTVLALLWWNVFLRITRERVAAPAPLAREVLAGTAVEAAPRLLGCQLTLRIVEVEAYGATGDLPDPASHAHRGPTAANQAMFAVRPTARGGSGRRGIRP